MNIDHLIEIAINIIVVLSILDSFQKVESKGSSSSSSIRSSGSRSSYSGGWSSYGGSSSSRGRSSSSLSSYSGSSNSVGQGSSFGGKYLSSLSVGSVSGSSSLKQSPNVYQYKSSSSNKVFVNDEKSSSTGKVGKFLKANVGAILNGKVITQRIKLLLIYRYILLNIITIFTNMIRG